MAGSGRQIQDTSDWQTTNTGQVKTGNSICKNTKMQSIRIMTPILGKWCLNCQIFSSLNAFWYYADNFNLVQSMSLQWSPEVTGTLTIRLQFWISGDFHQYPSASDWLMCVGVLTPHHWCLLGEHSVLNSHFSINLINQLSITGCSSQVESSLLTFNNAFKYYPEFYEVHILLQCWLNNMTKKLVLKLTIKKA